MSTVDFPSARGQAQDRILQRFFLSFLITGSLWALAMTYFLYLPQFSEATVHKEDWSVVTQLYTIAKNAFFVALISGMVLGICLPATYRWGRRRRREQAETSNAEPGTAPNGGPVTSLGNSGAIGRPPSVS